MESEERSVQRESLEVVAMSSKKLLILTVLLVILVAVAYMSGHRSSIHYGDSPRPGDTVIPEFDINTIRAIRIANPEATNRLVRKNDVWVVSSLFDYPADFSRIRSELTELTDLKIGQVMKGETSLTDEFGLGTDATSVYLENESEETLAMVRIGSSRTGGSQPGGGYPRGQYITTDDEYVFLISSSLSGFSSTSSDWIEKQLTQVEADEIETIEVHANDTNYVIHIDDQNVTTLETLGEDESFDAPAADRLKRALAYLNCQSVVDPSLSNEETGLDEPDSYTAHTRDGFSYKVQLGTETNGGRYAHFEISYAEPPAPTQAEAEKLVPESKKASDESEPTPPREQRMQEKLFELQSAHQQKVNEAKDQLDDLTRLNTWTYLIPAYAAASMTLSRDTFTKPIIEESEPISGGPEGHLETTEPASTNRTSTM